MADLSCRHDLLRIMQVVSRMIIFISLVIVWAWGAPVLAPLRPQPLDWPLREFHDGINAMIHGMRMLVARAIRPDGTRLRTLARR